jgi:hypothetical protein
MESGIIFNCVINTYYSGCQKNVPLNDRFFLQPLIPSLSISELIFEKRYKPIMQDIGLLVKNQHPHISILELFYLYRKKFRRFSRFRNSTSGQAQE